MVQGSKATTANPKDLFGSVKVSLTKLPAVAIAHAAHAMMDGARKYGAYNWRDKKVLAGIYVDAASRHLAAWFEGQETAADSGVHHLGHAIACCAILLDAQATGNLIDDRPVFGSPDTLANVLDDLSAKIKARKDAEDGKTTVSLSRLDEVALGGLTEKYTSDDAKRVQEEKNKTWARAAATKATHESAAAIVSAVVAENAARSRADVASRTKVGDVVVFMHEGRKITAFVTCVNPQSKYAKVGVQYADRDPYWIWDECVLDVVSPDPEPQPIDSAKWTGREAETN